AGRRVQNDPTERRSSASPAGAPLVKTNGSVGVECFVGSPCQEPHVCRLRGGARSLEQVPRSRSVGVKEGEAEFGACLACLPVRAAAFELVDGGLKVRSGGFGATTCAFEFAEVEGGGSAVLGHAELEVLAQPRLDELDRAFGLSS